MITKVPVKWASLPRAIAYSTGLTVHPVAVNILDTVQWTRKTYWSIRKVFRAVFSLDKLHHWIHCVSVAHPNNTILVPACAVQACLTSASYFPNSYSCTCIQKLTFLFSLLKFAWDILIATVSCLMSSTCGLADAMCHSKSWWHCKFSSAALCVRLALLYNYMSAKENRCSYIIQTLKSWLSSSYHQSPVLLKLC